MCHMPLDPVIWEGDTFATIRKSGDLPQYRRFSTGRGVSGERGCPSRNGNLCR